MELMCGIISGPIQLPFPYFTKTFKTRPCKKIIIINKKRFNIDTEATKISRTSSKLAKLAELILNSPKYIETSKGYRGNMAIESKSNTALPRNNMLKVKANNIRTMFDFITETKLFQCLYC